MNSDSNLHEITLYLRRLSAGDLTAENQLADAVYLEMQRIARSVVNGGNNNGSVEATALVNEVLIELLRIRSINWQDRLHFFRVASRLLRRRFIDHIRAGKAEKRPQKGARVDIDDFLLAHEERYDEMILIHTGLEQLAEMDPALAELVEMIYFGGVPIATLAELRNVSEKTIDRHLELARRCLQAKLSRRCPPLCWKSASSE